ncbi:MAG: hypothetical protein E7466_03495 [Ruminococcaceae bacterium]|nr:hypothetical protein [Oscillospiraceae bacterium]
MSQRLINPGKKQGMNGQTLRLWALIIADSGVFAHSVLQKMSTIYGTEFGMATIGAILQLISICAVPLFCFLLVEGVQHTKCYWKYFLRVLGLAVVCEVPYDLIFCKKAFYWGSQNPVLGLAVAMVMLYIIKSYAGKGIKSVLINIVAVVMAATWVDIIHVAEGLPIIFIVATFWFARKKKAAQIFVGAIVICMCSMLSLDPKNPVENLDYLLAPMAVVLLQFYNGEPGEGNKLINYAAYPAIMMACWLIARFAF